MPRKSGPKLVRRKKLIFSAKRVKRKTRALARGRTPDLRKH